MTPDQRRAADHVRNERLSMKDAITLIQTLGFPIFVAIYLLWDRTKLEARLDERNRQMILAMSNTQTALEQLVARLDTLCDLIKK
jgi:hypothetical protein